jgi:hypothetical protein
VTSGAQGNSGETVGKLYFVNGKEAVRASKRNDVMEKYWPILKTRNEKHIWSPFFIA